MFMHFTVKVIPEIYIASLPETNSENYAQFKSNKVWFILVAILSGASGWEQMWTIIV